LVFVIALLGATGIADAHTLTKARAAKAARAEEPRFAGAVAEARPEWEVQDAFLIDCKKRLSPHAIRCAMGITGVERTTGRPVGCLLELRVKLKSKRSKKVNVKLTDAVCDFLDDPPTTP
jgi:hypothetical protein